jgi:iron complex transport system ATP-binding protein
MLTLQNISYSIGTLQILNNVSFEALPGEITVIVGSNGAGKSTLLKIACGAMQATSGNVQLQAKRLSQWKPSELAKCLAVLQQQNVLSLPFKVNDVVMMGRYPHFKKQPSTLDFDVVNEALKKVGISKLADKNYLDLSGGEQQRVHLARVFAQIWASDSYDTRYLFMDEPSNNLDIRHQHNSLNMAREFAAEGHAVVAILHDLNLALQYADKIMLLKRGNAVAFGTPEEVMTENIMSKVFDYPLNIFNHPEYGHPIIMPKVHSNILINQ